MRRPALFARHAIMSISLCISVAPAAALERPQASPKDARIRCAAYDPYNVTQIDTAIGVATQVELNDDEDYVSHAFGDSSAYDFQQVGKHLLMKPRVEMADTNLVYITTKRSYSFLLRYSDARRSQEVFRLVMRYPESAKSRTAAAAEQEVVRSSLARDADEIHWRAYTMSGDAVIAPVAAWDDGAQTWLRFRPGQDLPVVYSVDADGQEILVNRHMEDDQTIVLHRVSPRWHVRLGEQVLAIHNEAPSGARALKTGTVSRSVQRVLREEADQ